MAGLAQDPGRDVAGSGDYRVLAANDDRSGDSREIHPRSTSDNHQQNPGPLGHGQEPDSRTTAQNAHPPSASQDEVRGGRPRASDHIAGQDRPQTAAPAGLAGPTPAGRPGSPAPDHSSAGSSQPSDTPAHPDEVPRRTLDEVRPFEQPGGLRPVEPEFQQAVENAVPRDSNGEPLVHPPVNHSWVDEVNDGGPWADSGRGINCVDATRAGLSTYYGDPQAAAARMLETDEFGRPDWAGEIDGISNMEEWAGARYSYTGTGDDGLDEVMQRVADAGPGASAAVLVEWAPTDPPEIDPGTGLPCDPGSHQLALINDNGRVLWVDFQTRTITDYFPFTEGVGDVWAITMDSDRNPVLDPDQGYPNASTEPPEGPPNRPAGETGDSGEGTDPSAIGQHVSPLLDAEEYLAQPHVAQALSRADEQGTTVVVDGAEVPIGQAIRRLLPQHPELAALLQETDYLEKSLLARPKTLGSLMNHPEAIPVLIDAAHEVRDRGPDEILAEHESAPGPEPTPLTPEQHTISEALRACAEEYLDTDRRQPDFDVSRKDDPQYRSQYLDRQYQQWEATQDALNAVVREVALETDGQAGWRNEPKDRVRAEDKVAGYEGNVSRLTDLVGAKIVFDSVSDIYRAAGLLASDERIEIVDFDDRFNEPVGSGYRDLQMKVRMPNGHIAELRLHLSHIDEVANYEHALYEGRRDLKALAESEGRELTPNESALKAALERRSVEMFQMALERGLT
ncbi:toxin glutamine deamidase domain-containing protein [Nocardia cyriacigeorgica]|nr:toxin glutamine deamidase domain-containing protein [Nocardia cyriacigeorgica]